MAVKNKKLSLAKAAEQLAILTAQHLASLPPAQRRKKIQAFNALAAEASARLARNRDGKRSRSSSSIRTQAIPVAARGR